MRGRAARGLLAALLVAGTLFAVATAAGAATKGVSIKDNFYQAAKVTIAKGTTVKWTNKGDNSHTVSKDGGGWSSGFLSPGDTYSHTFNKKGTFKYHCKVHSSMHGKVVVV